MTATAAWKLVGRLIGQLLRQTGRAPQAPSPTWRRSGYSTADYVGCPEMHYGRPALGGRSAGEMVWTWVAYEEDPSQGKDRPVLLVGELDGWLLGLPATSKDHDLDAEQERRAGRYWVEIGAGDWDSRGRVSEVRVDRIVRVDPTRVRRAAGRVDRAVFEKVAAGVRQHWDD